MEKQTKKPKKDYFIKNLSPPTFFKLFTSNFQDMIFALVRKVSIWLSKKSIL